MTETIGRHAAAVWDCAFSADGSFFATASRDQTVKVWDTGSATDVTTLRGHDGEVGACDVSPNGRFVVSAGDDGQVLLWRLGGISLPEDVRVPSGRSDLVLSDQITMPGHDAPILGCAISPDARCVVSASEDQRLKLWEPHTGRELATLRGHRGPVFDCAVSPDASTIVSASWDQTVTLWDVASCSARASLRGHSEPVTSCAISPDGSFVVSGSVDSRVMLFDLVKEELTGLGEHDGPVLSCAVSPDAAFVASAGADATLRLWDARARQELAAVALTSGLQCVALHPHVPMAICGDHAGGVHLVDLVGVDYGPLAITPVDADDRPGDPVLLCPKCRTLLAESKNLLGTELTCPGGTCDAELRINPFVASSPAPAPFGSGVPSVPSRADPPPPKKRRLWRKRR
jgi:WD40 repeat protein